MHDDGFEYVQHECTTCRELAPYELWRAGRLLARHCQFHHDLWWSGRDLARHELGELIADLEKTPAPAWTAGVEWHDGQYWPNEPIPE